VDLVQEGGVMKATFTLTITVDEDFVESEAIRHGRTFEEIAQEVLGRLECDLADVARWRHGIDQAAGVKSQVEVQPTPLQV
jgi:hypothetical protein